MRPPADESGARTDVEDRTKAPIQLQRDKYTGEALTPHYPVPSEPSIIWTPRGVSPRHFDRKWDRYMLDRMNPTAAKELREQRYGKPDVKETTPLGEDETYGTVSSSPCRTRTPRSKVRC